VLPGCIHDLESCGWGSNPHTETNIKDGKAQ